MHVMSAATKARFPFWSFLPAAETNKTYLQQKEAQMLLLAALGHIFYNKIANLYKMNSVYNEYRRE